MIASLTLRATFSGRWATKYPYLVVSRVMLRRLNSASALANHMSGVSAQKSGNLGFAITRKSHVRSDNTNGGANGGANSVDAGKSRTKIYSVQKIDQIGYMDYRYYKLF